MPQVFLNNELIGGFAELEALATEDRAALKSRLAATYTALWDGPVWVPPIWRVLGASHVVGETVLHSTSMSDLDSVQLLVRSVYATVPTHPRRRGLKKYQRVVLGADLIKAFSEALSDTRMAAAISVADKSIRMGFVARLGSSAESKMPIDVKSFYIFSRDLNPWVLNSFQSSKV